MTNQEKKEKLTDLIEFREPKWHTKEVYQEYRENINIYREDVKNHFADRVCSLFGAGAIMGPQNPYWKFYDVSVTAREIQDLWKNEKIISPPTTGQDPKTYSQENIKIASKHAGNMWGMKGCSFWLREIVFNLVMYPDYKLVLETTDAEHRLWGIIGAALDLIPIDSDQDLYYENTRIKNDEHRIKINGLYLSEISKKASSDGCIITEDEVRNYYFQGHITLRLLPSFTDKECKRFFTELNTSSNKTIPQILHSTTYDSTSWIRSFSSLKEDRFTSGDNRLHPFYKLFKQAQQLKLETLMITHVIIQYVLKGCNFIVSSNAEIAKEVYKTRGYATVWNSNKENIINTVLDKLTILNNFYSEIPNPFISRQMSQIVLKIVQTFEEDGYVVRDWNLFSNDIYTWIEKNRKEKSETSNRMINTTLGSCITSSDIPSYTEAFGIIRRNLLNDYLNGQKDCSLIGICKKSKPLERTFSRETLYESFYKNNGNDVDGKPMKTQPMGGHKVSHMELSRSTDSERDEIFKSEGICDYFDFNSNCVAISDYHNNRMGVLRLNHYLQIINKDDSYVNQVKNEYYNYLSSKPILC